MKELSIFVDESGDWGEYAHHSPYYIISFIFHDQSINITDELIRLENDLRSVGYRGHCVHAGPIIRGEEEYKGVDIATRKKIFAKMMGFFRRMDINQKSFYIEKKQFDDSLDAIGRLSKQLAIFIREDLEYFFEFDTVKIYYDKGQNEVNKILSSVFNVLLDNVEFKKVMPKDYRLFQMADFVCTMKLLELKMEQKSLSRSEIFFFDSEKVLKKNYIKHIHKKELNYNK